RVDVDRIAFVALPAGLQDIELARISQRISSPGACRHLDDDVPDTETEDHHSSFVDRKGHPNIQQAGSWIAAKAATTTIPIVFNTSADPVAVGLVSSLNRPGGTVTGITSLNAEVTSKRLELLHEVVPKASSIGLLVNQASGIAHVNIADMQAASRTLGLQILVLNASSNDEIDEAFATLVQRGVGALVVTADSLF